MTTSTAPVPHPSLPPAQWRATLPRELVHKRAVSEVLLTALEVPAAGSVLLHAQWPAGNRFYRQADGSHYGINVVLECVRQACIAATHEALGVALEDQFIMLALAADVGAAALESRPAPVDLILQGALERDSASRLGRRIAWTFKLAIDGIVVGSGRGELIAMDPDRYRSMRTTQLTKARSTRRTHHRVALAGVDAQDKLLAVTSDHTALLVVDETHPNYFDHPLDHVPGMLMIDAACSLARHVHEQRTTDTALVTAVDTKCAHFAELVHVCSLQTQSAEEPSTGDMVHLVTLEQNDTECCSSRIRTQSR